MTALPAEFRPVAERLKDWRWRLNNLYRITDKDGREVQFRLNWAQADLFQCMHFLSLILKARQLGMSTFILLYMLDACLFNSNVRCGIIDVRLDDAKKKLEKVKFAYERVPKWLLAARPVKVSNATTLEFDNGSGLEVGTSHRGGTLQYLHVSEFGKITAKFPDKAREIRTGALNTVQAGQVAWVESTAEGQEGDFFDMCQLAQTKQRTGTKLTPLDFKFAFYPWWAEPGYELDPDGVVIPSEFARYFDEIEGKPSFVGCTPTVVPKISASKRAWYVKKAETQLEDMKREYPSTPEEAFAASVEGAIYGAQMEAAEREGRIGVFPAVPGVPVHSFWDIGRKDYSSVWYAQIFSGPRLRFVHFYQNAMTGMPHYAAYQKQLFTENKWTPGEDFFPHDAKVIEWGSDRSRMEQLIAAGFRARLQTQLGLHDGINSVRAILPFCEFDEAGCAEGIKILKTYRWEWDDLRAAWKTGSPRHDKSSHGADAMRGAGTSFREVEATLPPEPGRMIATPRGQVFVPDPIPKQTTLEDLWAANQRPRNWRI